MIDSNLWIEYFSGSLLGKKVQALIEGEEKIMISTINIAEIYRHVLSKRNKADAERANEILLQYSFSIPVTNEIAKAAAILKHEKKVGLADAIIYATATQENAQVITADNDFRGFENTQIIS
ncbi:type II toxin-antitoxin system VapC family toxin [Candidatus Woesearchaeota archaeon]|nr:type II toxin-antitoxin system VapC family toxin [Candidatus Woesearchaeota archaeon]